MTWYNYKKCPECEETVSLNTSQLHLGDFRCDKCGWKGGRLQKMPIDDNSIKPSSDMDLRDQFAVEAMKVLLTNNPNRPLAEVGKSAYILADIMINERYVESVESAVEPNTEVIDPCDYDQGSYMYMSGNCIKIDCNRLDEAIKTIASQGYRCVQKEQCAGGQCHCMTCPSYQWGEL